MHLVAFHCIGIVKSRHQYRIIRCTGNAHIDSHLKRLYLGDNTDKCLKMFLHPQGMLSLALSICAINEAPHNDMLEHNSFLLIIW